MGRLEAYLELVKQSRLLAANLKEATLRYHTGNAHTGNQVARKLVRDHLMALRWMNPNAVIYQRVTRGQGTPELEYKLWVGDGATHTMEIKGKHTAEEVIAKLMMAARDPALDDEKKGAEEGVQGDKGLEKAVTGAATGLGAATAAAAAARVAQVTSREAPALR